MTETILHSPANRGQFNKLNAARSGPVFEVRAALKLSRAALAAKINSSSRTIEGAERRGGALTGAPGVSL